MTDLFSIAGKTALVTGGSRGIGLMIARGYVERGARVYISSRKKEACEAVATELSEIGECYSLPADLGQMSEIERVAVALAERESSLDILVNNAGATWGATVDQFPESGWDKVLGLNAKAVFFLTQKLLPLLAKAASPETPARVINVGSIDGMHTSIFENYSYAASKAAVHHLTRVLAAHLAVRHITVNGIAPGPFMTDMMAPMVAKLGEAIVNRVPLKRMGLADDAVGIATFLASKAANYITGVVIPVDGGIMAAV
ncbi:MAG: SDR family oxidoreductase [Gammaproteobacteria bacterium]